MLNAANRDVVGVVRIGLAAGQRHATLTPGRNTLVIGSSLTGN